MTMVLRGIRVIDPSTGTDLPEQDVLFEAGRITGIGPALASAEVDIDLRPAGGEGPCVLAPGFIDLHTHLREPGGERAETLASGARAAAAGGFTHVLAMANTDPPCDTPARVAGAVQRSAGLPVRVLTVAALTRGLAGNQLVDIEGCAAAGAVAFSDDGRNAAPGALLAEGLRAAGRVDRPVLIHAEAESLIGPACSVVRCPDRPRAAEAAAVHTAIAALGAAGAGRLHLQHLSTAEAVALTRSAREDGLAVSAEVTPHHLTMAIPLEWSPVPAALAKVNPPLRDHADRTAVVAALREGVIDAIATDHAPHPWPDKDRPYGEAAPGMIGLETALGTCWEVERGDAEWQAVVVARLTEGPYRVLANSGVLPAPGLRLGEPATCVLFDPSHEWTAEAGAFHSRSSNTPLLGRSLRGRVLMTLVEGVIAHVDAARLPVLEHLSHV